MSIPPINVEQARINRDKTCDKIPLVSTGTNLIDLFQKIHYRNQPAAAHNEDTYSAYIQNKSVGRCILLMIPIIGNIIIAIKDNLHAKKAAEPVKAATKTATISEADLSVIPKETFWDFLEAQGAEKLVVACKDGKSVTYEKGFFNRLLANKPDLADLTRFITVEFSDQSEREEPMAKLRMCGTTIVNLFGDIESPRLTLNELSQEDFQGVLHAIEDEVFDISTYSAGVQNTMDYLGFHPAGVPEGVHGKKDWNARGVDVGKVPPPPEELLDALNQPCPIAKDSSKMIDTHVILWMPPTLNGEPITVDNLLKVATSDAFGENKIGLHNGGYIFDSILADAVINQSLERGYWLAQYKSPVAAGVAYAEKEQFVAGNCHRYKMPKVRETIASLLMQYGCSGDKKELILTNENGVSESIHDEIVLGLHVLVGLIGASELFVHYSHNEGSNRLGVCPVRRFF